MRQKEWAINMWGSRIGLLVILLITAGFRFWNLEGNGFGNIYYAAAGRNNTLDK